MRRPATAWAVSGLSLAMFAAALVLQLLSLGTPVTGVFGSRGLVMIPGAAFTLLGALVAIRQPRNLIGWLLLAAGFLSAVQQLAYEYAIHGLLGRGTLLIAPSVAAWVSGWIWVLIVGAVGVFVILLFPDGRLPSPRWAPLAWIGAGAVALGTFGSMILPGSMDSGLGIDNPFGLEDPSWLAEVALNAGLMMLNISLVATSGSLIIRFRRAATIERAQIKWLALGAGLLAGVLIVGSPIFATSNPEAAAYRLLANATVASMAALPLAVGVAILRYHLYDIDRIISRTLAYGALTAVLVGGYFLAVLMLRSVLPLQQDSPLIVAASTLAVVAAFGPLRARIQAVVDRRFNRSRYDAARTVETFGARLRAEVNIDSLSLDLADVVDRTLQPAHVSVWFTPLKDER